MRRTVPPRSPPRRPGTHEEEEKGQFCTDGAADWGFSCINSVIHEEARCASDPCVEADFIGWGQVARGDHIEGRRGNSTHRRARRRMGGGGHDHGPGAVHKDGDGDLVIDETTCCQAYCDGDGHEAHHVVEPGLDRFVAICIVTVLIGFSVCFEHALHKVAAARVRPRWRPRSRWR